MTRIIGGLVGGRRLKVPATGTRPTADRVREALFSALDARLDHGWRDVDVLDLCAGSGALGLEAASRGARSAVLVESSAAAFAIAQDNARALGLAGVTVLRRDARSLAQSPAPSSPPNLCLVDPPYDWPARDVRSMLASLESARWLAPGALVVVERRADDAESPLPDAWHADTQRRYGDTALWYGRVPRAAQGANGRQVE